MDKVRYFDISLVKGMHVILTLGTGKNAKAAGLGTSRNIIKAVQKSQMEILQYFAVSSSKRKRRQTKLKLPPKDNCLQYFDSLSTKEFVDAYRYLWDIKSCVDMDEYVGDYIYARSEIIHKVFQELNIMPEIAVFVGRENLKTKTVKIMDDNWFPHMFPSKYSDELIKDKENFFNRKARCIEFFPFA